METVLIKEFREMVKTLQARNVTMSIYNMPLPEQLKQGVLDTTLDMVTAQGVEEEYYKELNGEIMYLIGKASLKKRRVTAQGDFWRDENNEIVWIDVPVPRGSVAVYSSKNIRLKNTTKDKRGRVVKRENPNGFGYVDYIIVKGTKYYIYIIPRELIYHYTPLELILTTTKRKSHYKGISVYLKSGQEAYLYIVDKKKRTVANTIQLYVDISYNNLDSLMAKFVKYLQVNNYAFDYEATVLPSEPRGKKNIAYDTLLPTQYIEDYQPIGNNLVVRNNKIIQTD